VLVDGFCLQDLDVRERCRDADFVCVVAAAVPDIAFIGGREALHQIATTSQRGDGEASAESLSQTGQVRRNVGDRLVATEAVTEAGDHLVEDEDDSVSIADRSEAFEEPRLRHDRH